MRCTSRLPERVSRGARRASHASRAPRQREAGRRRAAARRAPPRDGCGRGAQAHSAKSGEDLTAFEKFPEARTVDVTVVAPNKQLIGKTFKRDARAVQVRAASPTACKLLRWGRQVRGTARRGWSAGGVNGMRLPRNVQRRACGGGSAHSTA